MIKIFFSTLILFISITIYSQENNVIATPLDTVENGRFKMVILDNYTWQYVNHDSVMSILEYEDSVKVHNYILANKLYYYDSVSIFSENWDTSRLLTYGDMSYERALDTVAIRLVEENRPFHIPSPGNISSKFGWRYGRMHNGTDLQLRTGDTVVAAFDGVVRYTGYFGGYGNLVVIRHYNGLETFYSHLSAIKCSRNTEIKAGELVGLGGRTGRATGPHLHFEVRYKDNPIDPETIIDFENGVLVDNMLYLLPEKFGYIKEICEAQYHTIASGDSLYAISRKYRTTIKQLCNLNDISENSTLRIGNTLRIR